MGIFLFLLSLLGKGTVTGIGSKGGQILVDKLKEKFGATLGEQLGEAYWKASENQSKIGGQDIPIDGFLSDDSYYLELTKTINGDDDLSSYDKQIRKLFLIEIFKNQPLANQLLSLKLDEIMLELVNIRVSVTEILESTKREELKNILNTYAKDHFLSRIDYENFPTHYIPRRIVPNNNLFTERDINSFNEILQYSRNYAQNKSHPLRALIIADGGIGKSVFSKHLAKDCANNENQYPIFVSLRDLKPSDILQEYIIRRFADISKISTIDHAKLCFFLDGFDEVGDSSSAIKQVSDFCRTYSASHIILTSRRNSFFGQFSDFHDNLIFTLSDLNFEDIKDYIYAAYAKYKIDTTVFFAQVCENNFANLIYNPFYLDVLINCYISNNNSLAISKKELIDNLIASRREKDKQKRPDLELDKPNIRRKVLQLGKKFAFIQALMDQRSLSESNIAQLFDNDFDLAINSLPIKKGQQVNNEQHWEFEHNIFLEHLAADVLKDLDVSQILEYASSNNSIKSKWRDIISHLLGILDENNKKEKALYDSLVNWLAECDAEILLKLENSQLSKEFRSNIFLRMYRKYQDTTIWIDTNRVNPELMADFGETKENVQQLFNDIINENEHYRRRINASLIFQHFSLQDFSEEERIMIADQYIESLSKIDDSTIEEKETLEYYMITNFPFINRVEEIINIYCSTSNSRLISAILHLIGENNLQDKYIESIITIYIKEKRHQTTGNFHLNSSYYLTQLKEESSYITFFNTLHDEKLYNSYYNKDEFKIIIKNSSKFSSPALIKSIIMLCSKHGSWTRSNEWETFAPFFEHESIRQISVEILLDLMLEKKTDEMSDWMFQNTLARIIREEDLPHIFEKIDNQELFTTILRRVDKESEIYDKVIKHLISKYDFQMPEAYVDPYPDRRKEEFNILFEKDRFKKECLTIFNEIGDEFDPSDLYELSIEDKYYNHSLVSFMRWFIGSTDTIKRKNLEKWFDGDTDRLDEYLHGQICRHIPQWNSSTEMPELSEHQMKIIKAYYDERINHTSFFIDVDIETRMCNFQSTKPSILVIYMQRFNFECPDNKLCEMLGNFNADFNFIVNKTSNKEILKGSILNNLGNHKNFVDSRIFNMMQYCIDNKIDESWSSILEILKDPNFGDYQKMSTIKKCIEKNILVEELIQISSYLTQYQRLELCERLIKHEYTDKQTIIELLYNILENPEGDNNELFALSLLIWLKEKKALILFIDYCKRESKVALYSPFDGVTLGRDHLPDDYLQYDDINLLPLLIELLELNLRSDIQSSRRSGKIEQNMIHLASLSEDNYIEVTMTLKEFIENNKNKYTDVEYLNFTINRIEELYKEKQSKRYTFGESIKIGELVVGI